MAWWGNVVLRIVAHEFEATIPDKFTTWIGDNPHKGGHGAGKVLAAADFNVDASIRNGVSMKRIFRKYSIYDWDDNGFHPGGVNQRVIRYADVLLMLAECEAEVGTPAQAATYINMVRARPSVNMPAVVLGSKNQALRAVMHERAVE